MIDFQKPFFPSRVDPLLIEGWMACDFTSFLSVFQSHQDDERDNETLCAMQPRLQLRRFRLERDPNPGPLDQ